MSVDNDASDNPYRPSQATQPYPIAGFPLDHARVCVLVRPPAATLCFLGTIAVLLEVGYVVHSLLPGTYAHPQDRTAAAVLFGMFAALHFFMVVSAIWMYRLENYGAAVASSLTALLPCFSPLVLIGIPIGLWSLCILARSDVRAAFEVALQSASSHLNNKEG